MKPEEVRKMLSVIKATYRKHYENMSNNDLKSMFDVWSDVFEEDDPIIIMTALKCYLRQNTSGFPPVPAQLIDIASNISKPSWIDTDEAWNAVYRALSNSIYHSKEEFEKLPPDVQAGVGSPDQLRSWATMDNSQVQTVVMSMFKKGYSGRVKEKREFDKLPETAKNLISGLTQAKRLGDSKKG